MERERLKTPDDDMVAEFGKILELFDQALPSASDKVLFNRLMNEANARGLSWVEGLNYVAQRLRSDFVCSRGE